jgi:putative 4-mercaptohistidine N1-methyltranferase
MRDAATRDVQLGTARDPVMTASGTQFGLKGINVNLAFGSPTPVNASPVSSSGFHDTLGNVWEWCEDDFNPLPGFKADALYEDFSTPCFDGKHTLILGGSFASTGDEASIWARFHFRPHFGQHAGFRLACSANGDPSCDAVKIGEETLSIDVYETRQALDEYLLLHFGEPTDQMPYAFGPQGAVNFPSRCAQLVLDAAKQVGITGGRALDLGCAVGRATFELARGFDEVIGVDLSHGFVDAAHAIQQTGHVAYRLKDEGDLGAELVAGIDPAIDRTRVSFSQADACALPEDFVGFDAVLMANLLCRLPSPRLLLERLAGPCGLVRPGGLLVLVSPYTWMDKFTPKETWLGGYYERDGAQVRSADALKSFLATEFELLKEQDLPLVIREHVRKYQFIVSHAMVWRRLP